MDEGEEAAKEEIRLILSGLKWLNDGTSLDELLRVNEAWVARLIVLDVLPETVTLPERMLLLGTPIATDPAIRSAAVRARRECASLIGRLALVREQSAATNVPPSAVLQEALAKAKAHRATFHARTRRAPPQDATPAREAPACARPYIYKYSYDARKPQIQQYEDDILGEAGNPGPAQGVPVVLDFAPSLPPNVRGALQYTNVYQSWTGAFGLYPEDPAQPALEQALALAASGPQPMVPNGTPVYVLDGANIFHRSQARWDAKNECARQFANAAFRPGPVIIVMQHHHFVENLLTTKSGVRTDANLEHLDLFLCQLHGWQFPVVILEIQPEQCQDTMLLPDGEGGEFPCLYNDRNKEWPKTTGPDGRERDFVYGEPGFNDPPRQKNNSYCSVWGEEEEKTSTHKRLLHDFCEFDDAIVDQLVSRSERVNHTRAFRVSGDARITTNPKRDDIWKEMSRLNDRLRVRLYLMVQRAPVAAPVASESIR